MHDSRQRNFFVVFGNFWKFLERNTNMARTCILMLSALVFSRNLEMHSMKTGGGWVKACL